MFQVSRSVVQNHYYVISYTMSNLHVKYNFTDCKCNYRGSVSKSCDNNTGICACKPHIVGAKCDQCDEGYYGWSWPDCEGK